MTRFIEASPVVARLRERANGLAPRPALQRRRQTARRRPPRPRPPPTVRPQTSRTAPQTSPETSHSAAEPSYSPAGRAAELLDVFVVLVVAVVFEAAIRSADPHSSSSTSTRAPRTAAEAP